MARRTKSDVPPKPDDSPLRDSQVVQGLAPHKFMTLASDLLLERDSIIETDRGLRLKLDYGKKGTATYFPAAPVLINGTMTAQIDGEIASGADWVTVRRDGVVEFDSRITLRFEMVKDDKDERYLIDGTFQGVLDLGPEGATDDEIFLNFVRGVQPVKGFKVAFSARFEGSSGPPRGRDASWVPKRLKNAAKYFDTFRPLVRQQFNTTGFVTVEQGPYYPPKTLSLNVFGGTRPAVHL
jgi:uncharacterized protein DUF3237